MKSLLTIIILAGILLYSCQSGNEEDQMPTPTPNTDECENVEASLSGNVIPIINTKCAVSGCHISGAQFPDFTNKSNIIQFSSGIRTNTHNGTMPPQSSGFSLTADELRSISCWVAGGALDN